MDLSKDVLLQGIVKNIKVRNAKYGVKTTLLLKSFRKFPDKMSVLESTYCKFRTIIYDP